MSTTSILDSIAVAARTGEEAATIFGRYSETKGLSMVGTSLAQSAPAAGGSQAPQAPARS